MTEAERPATRRGSGPTKADSPPEVSVVIPCLDEAESVGICVEKALQSFREFDLTGEVVVVDNGSTDGSPEIARAAGARVVREARKGYGSAYLRGFAEARGRYLVMGDADDTYDFSEVPRFVQPLREEGCDLVIGDRLGGKILPGAMPWSHRWIGNPIISTLIRILFGTGIHDAYCGMRAFTREAYRRMSLRTTGMEFALEMVVASLREGLEIREIPIIYHPRKGESKLQSFRDAWRSIRFMFLFSPSYLFLLPGTILTLLGLLLVLPLAGGPLTVLGRQWDFHVLLVGAPIVVLGFNLILFDLFAKTFAIGEGFRRPGPALRQFLDKFSLERGLIAGALLFLAGLGAELWVIVSWLESGRGALMAIRPLTLGMLGMLLGAQTVFGSFLVSLFLVERR